MTTLLSLNVWGGKLFDPLMHYVSDVSSYVDIFCFQEMLSTVTDQKYDKTGKWRIDLFCQMSRALPEFTGYYAPATDFYYYSNNGVCDFSGGLAIFVHKDTPIALSGDIFIFHSRNIPISQDVFLGSGAPRNLQYIVVPDPGGWRTMIANFHGLWTGIGKNDTPERIEQSRNIMRFLNQFNGKKILCGDFNLRPQTESLCMIEYNMRNLIKERSIFTTRSSYYDKCDQEPHADYMMVSRNIKIDDFRVDTKEVSDHLALVLEY